MLSVFTQQPQQLLYQTGWTIPATTVLRPFFRDHLGEPVPEENFWTLWCKGRLTESDALTIRLGATPSGLSSAHLHHLTIFLHASQPTVSKHWRQLAHLDQGEDARVLLNSVTCNVSVPLYQTGFNQYTRLVETTTNTKSSNLLISQISDIHYQLFTNHTALVLNILVPSPSTDKIYAVMTGKIIRTVLNWSMYHKCAPICYFFNFLLFLSHLPPKWSDVKQGWCLSICPMPLTQKWWILELWLLQTLTGISLLQVQPTTQDGHTAIRSGQKVLRIWRTAIRTLTGISATAIFITVFWLPTLLFSL